METMRLLRFMCRRRFLDNTSLSFCTHSRSNSTFPSTSDFTFVPNFFNATEQRVLLAAALQKLDAMESRSMQRKRKNFIASQKGGQTHKPGSLDAAFLPDKYYQFEEVPQHSHRRLHSP